jgi:hypothetical protein
MRLRVLEIDVPAFYTIVGEGVELVQRRLRFLAAHHQHRLAEFGQFLDERALV